MQQDGSNADWPSIKLNTGAPNHCILLGNMSLVENKYLCQYPLTSNERLKCPYSEIEYVIQVIQDFTTKIPEFQSPVV
jgi:hypothetical protein